MADPTSSTLATLADYVRGRLAAVGEVMFSPLRARDAGAQPRPETAVAAARQMATVIVAAGAPFASTAHARARLLRQLHASGLLRPGEGERADVLLREHAS